jgi:hypothetical protein
MVAGVPHFSVKAGPAKKTACSKWLQAVFFAKIGHELIICLVFAKSTGSYND